MEIVVGLPRDPRSKIASREEAVARVARWAEVGRRVVFTNGCFDLLHQGHARYLAAARRLGDALVVGINSDASVRRLKGEKRPLLPEDERAELIASLECVDLVVIFGEDDPAALIAAIKPKVLVKGADWPKAKVIGREIVESLGGEVKNIPLVEGRSTTKVIEEILEKYK